MRSENASTPVVGLLLDAPNSGSEVLGLPQTHILTCCIGREADRQSIRCSLASVSCDRVSLAVAYLQFVCIPPSEPQPSHDHLLGAPIVLCIPRIGCNIAEKNDTTDKAVTYPLSACWKAQDHETVSSGTGTSSASRGLQLVCTFISLQRPMKRNFFSR